MIAFASSISEFSPINLLRIIFVFTTDIKVIISAHKRKSNCLSQIKYISKKINVMFCFL